MASNSKDRPLRRCPSLYRRSPGGTSAHQCTAKIALAPLFINPENVPQSTPPPKRKDREADAVIYRLKQAANGRATDVRPVPPDVLERSVFGSHVKTEDEYFSPGESSDDDRPKKKRRVRKCKPMFDEQGNPTKHAYTSTERAMENMYHRANVNKVVFHNFNFQANCIKKTQREPSEVITWEDEHPRVGYSADNHPIVMYCPGAVGLEAQAKIEDSLYEYAAAVPPDKHTTAKSKSKPKMYKEIPGEIHGENRLVRGWHAIGRKEEKDFVPSGPVIRTGAAYNATLKIMKDLRLLAHRVNVLTRCLDPNHYYDAVYLKNELRKRYPGYDAISYLDDLVYDGREVLWNVQSELHCDLQDPIFSWAILCIFGNFKGGHLRLPNVGLRVRMEPGDIVLLRGRVIRHVIEDWKGGQRISIPHFTHRSVWQMVQKFADSSNVGCEDD